MKIAVVGLGYVGLPLAVEFGKKYPTIGFDLSAEKIAAYRNFIDPTGEVSSEDLRAATQLSCHTDPEVLREADFIIVAVPTPVDEAHQPDFTPLITSSESVGKYIKRGAIVVYESTVYPGATEEVCIPLIEKHSGLKWKKDFFVGYSPERINPGASSSTYGDHPDLPKVEDKIGKPLSPYAVTKYVNELYADVFARTYGFNTIGLRYFNVFGPRQDPNGAYAAVIPKWIASMIKGEPIYINGDGETSRDFCFIENVRQINLLAATTENSEAVNQVYNVAVGDRTTLNQLYEQLHLNLLPSYPHLKGVQPVYRDFRAGDVRHSLADISKAATLLGYQPTHRIGEGLKVAMGWYMQQFK